MSLLSRVTVHDGNFSLAEFAPLYARLGTGPNGPTDIRVPQRTSCLLRRLITGTYLLRRVNPLPESTWPVRAPQRIVVVHLKGERLAVRMRSLAFFEEGLRLSTILNLQIPWMSFESPLITCLTGTGRVGIRIDGPVDCIACDEQSAPARVNLLRLAAWSNDTVMGVEVEPGYANTVLCAPAAALIKRGQLAVAGRDDDETTGTLGFMFRLSRLVVP